MKLNLFCMIAIIFFIISCGDDEKTTELVESSNNSQINHQSGNNSDTSQDCDNNDQCTPEQPIFKQFPGGFKQPICDMGELSKTYGIRCTECLSDQDCLENELCNNFTWCAPK